MRLYILLSSRVTSSPKYVSGVRNCGATRIERSMEESAVSTSAAGTTLNPPRNLIPRRAAWLSFLKAVAILINFLDREKNDA